MNLMACEWGRLCCDGQFLTKVSSVVEIIISLSDLVTSARCL